MIINTINTSGCQPQTIVIGRRGTYDTMQIAFDLSYLVESYGNGAAVLAVKRSQDESAYPAVTSQEDDLLLWTVSETDTYYVGAGECQLMWYVDGGLAKTIIYPMVVMRDILATSEEAPDAYQEWVDALIAEGAETLQNAQNAAQSASDAENAKDDTVAAKGAAEAAQAAAEAAQAAAEDAAESIEDSAAQITQNTQDIAYLEDEKQDKPATAGTAGQVLGLDANLNPVWVNQSSGGVTSVNGKTGAVTLDASDVGAGTYFKPSGGIPASDLASAVQTSLGKADSAYQKPVGGIPATDLASAVQTSLGKADTALQSAPVSSVAGKTGAVSLDAGDIEFDDSETYAAGSIGAEVSQQKNAISQNEEAVADTQSMIATVEATATASKNYAVGDLLVYDGKLYKVTSAIATGATIIVGSNVTQTTVETQLASAGSGNAKWTLIVDDTTTEDKTQIDYDISSEQWHKVLGIMSTPANGQTGQNINARAFSDVVPRGGGHVCLYATGQNRSQYITYTTFVIDCSTGRHFADYTAGQYALSNGMSNRTIRPDMMGTDTANYYTEIIYIGDFPSGTTVQLYGIK